MAPVIPPKDNPSVDTDPVLDRRAVIARWCRIGKRVGYLLYGAALVLFFAGLSSDFHGWIAATITACMLIGAIALIPAILFGYGVKAADREDRERAAGGESAQESGSRVTDG